LLEANFERLKTSSKSEKPQVSSKKKRLCLTNEHLEFVINVVAATQIDFNKLLENAVLFT